MSTVSTSLKEQYLEAKAKNLALDMTRGKPGSDQLDLTLPMLDLVTSSDYKSFKGEDPRNYGGLDGLPEMKELFKEFLGPNYASIVTNLGIVRTDLVEQLEKKPELLEQMDYAIISGGWFWNKNNLNSLADKDDILTITKRINGGTIGLDSRKEILQKIKKIM